MKISKKTKEKGEFKKKRSGNSQLAPPSIRACVAIIAIIVIHFHSKGS
jgi:hypothetical protein